MMKIFEKEKEKIAVEFIILVIVSSAILVFLLNTFN